MYIYIYICPLPPQIDQNLILLSYMAVWPDPTHGKCSYAYFGQVVIFGKMMIFERILQGVYK